MSQQQYNEQSSFLYQSSGTINNFNNFNQNVQAHQEDSGDTKKIANRRDDTNAVYGELFLGTYKVRPGERIVIRTSGRKNKNEILGLTLALLTKEKYLYGGKYARDLELSRGIQMNPSHGEFVLILRTDGRIVAMSDEVEQHLGKTMRSLYTQCINIYQCLDEADGNKLHSVLNSSVDLTHQEHRLVCTFRLPKGKRPSRTREDIKTITMTGHFYSCNEGSLANERLFIARCEALVSRTTNRSNLSQNTNYTNSMINFTLNEDMSINIVSPNVRDILGYSRHEMVGNWLGRYLATKDLEKFENIRQRYFSHEQQQQQQLPANICDIFDMYTNNGDGRLTFLYQIRPVRERRSKVIKFSIVAQLIDPSVRNECLKYVQNESETTKIKSIKAEQVNLGAQLSSSISKTSEDTIMATNSPSLANGLLMFDNANINEFNQQYSPFNRSLSNAVAPVNVDDRAWEQLFDFNDTRYSPIADFQFCSTKSIDNAFIECQSEQGLANIFDEYLNGYYMGDDLF